MDYNGGGYAEGGEDNLDNWVFEGQHNRSTVQDSEE